jgi:hypothetical protein
MRAGVLTAAAVVFILPVAAMAETQTEQQACVDDAFRVCSSAMPDRHDVFVCLVKNSSQLSDACREVMARYSSHPRSGQWRSDPHGQDGHSN